MTTRVIEREREIYIYICILIYIFSIYIIQVAKGVTAGAKARTDLLAHASEPRL